MGQFLVTGMHLIGFSGGAINLIFDLFFPPIAAVLIFKIFRKLNYCKSDSYLAAILIMTIPILFGTSNPLYSQIFYSNISSGAIQWITMPEAYYPPFFRSPEPQFSLTIMALAVYISLKKNTLLPLYLIMPFLYPFVRIPFMFIVLTLHIIKYCDKIKLFKSRFALIGPGVFAYVAISAMIIIHHKVLMDGMRIEIFMVATRFPILSMTGIICLLLFLVVRNVVDEKFKNFLALVAFSPIVAVNTQIISGIIAQPNNFEQNFGTVCIAFLLAFGMISIKSRLWSKNIMAGLAIALVLAYSKTIYSVNSFPHLRQPLPATLLKQLRVDPSKVAVHNAGMATALNLVWPMQGITGLAITQTFGTLPDDYFTNYLCLKKEISRNEELYPDYSNILEGLGDGYRHLHANFIFIHINRRKSFKIFYDPETIPEYCPEMTLYYYPVNN